MNRCNTVTYHLFTRCSYLNILFLVFCHCSPLNSTHDCDLGDCLSLAVEVSCSSHLQRDSDIHSSSEPPVSTSSVLQVGVSSDNQILMTWSRNYCFIIWSCCSLRCRGLWVQRQTVDLEAPIWTNQPLERFSLFYYQEGKKERKKKPKDLRGDKFKSKLSSCSVPSNGLSGSDSEASCSNLNTAIHSALPSVHTQLCGAAVELWVESTTKEPSIRRGERTPSLPFILRPFSLNTEIKNPSPPLTNQELRRSYQCSSSTTSLSLSSAPAWDLWTGTPLWPPAPATGQCAEIPALEKKEERCEVNKYRDVLFLCASSEALLALQTEVTRLKKDLEDGLVQLPHLAQRMDYLTSKYREERQEHRSKSRAHRTPTPSR